MFCASVQASVVVVSYPGRIRAAADGARATDEEKLANRGLEAQLAQQHVHAIQRTPLFFPVKLDGRNKAGNGG